MYTLRPYQKLAVDESMVMIDASRALYDSSKKQTAIILSAPTGAGKTVMSGAVIDRLLSPVSPTEESPYTILWITDNPSLNRQSASRIKESRGGSFPVYAISGSGVFTNEGGGVETFDQETFDQGTLYFLNTQAASESAGFSRRSKFRTYTVWETIANTVGKYGSSFIVMIDEAHRGVESEISDNQTVIGKIIDSVPIVYGISATEEKFTKWMTNKKRHVHNIDVSISDVKESGAIKNSLVVSDTVDGSDADLTLLKDAVRQTLAFESGWQNYCANNNLRLVLPLLIVQVENSGSTPDEQDIFSMDIHEKIEAVLDEWKGLKGSNIVHTFSEKKDLVVTDPFGSATTVAYMDPDLIDGNNEVRVVFAKTAIATGWDCPRAEVLVSFRGAADKTYITQLIGRMIRQPHNQRIAEDESLNSAYCTLPKFNKKAVAEITQKLKDEGLASEVVNVAPVAYKRNLLCGTAPFEILAQIPSYSVPKGRLASTITRLRRFAAALSRDEIFTDANQHSKDMICLTLDALTQTRPSVLLSALEYVKEADVEMRESMASVVMTRSAIGMDSGSVLTSVGEEVLTMDQKDYEKRFLSDSVLPVEVRNIYRNHLCSVYGMPLKEVNRRIKAFNYRSFGAYTLLESTSGLLIKQWVRTYRAQVSEMMFKKGEKYRIYQEAFNADDMSPFVELISVVPNVIQENLDAKIIEEGASILGSADDLIAVRNWALSGGSGDHHWAKHIYANEDHGNLYLKHFDDSRCLVLANELQSDECVGWYNNPVDGPRSITAPYVDGDGRWAVMRPDFILFHAAGEDVVKPSILHVFDGQSSDLMPQKIRGWIDYAAKHSSDFHSIRMAISVEEQGILAHIDLTSVKAREALCAELSGDTPSVDSTFLKYGEIYGA